MPAGIRLDIHIGGFRDSAETQLQSKERLRSIVDRLAEEVRRVLMEETNVEMDENANTLTTADMVPVLVSDGLGPDWPPEPESDEPTLLSEGLAKHLDDLESGKTSRTLGRTEAYDDGSFRVFVSVDLT